MTKHIYIAGPYGRRDEAEKLVDEFWANGFVIPSRWHSGPPGDPANRTPEIDRKIAMQNWSDLFNADILVALIHPEIRGTIGEICGAIATPDIDVFLVGKQGDGPTPMVEHDSVTWVSREHVVSYLSDVYSNDRVKR